MTSEPRPTPGTADDLRDALANLTHVERWALASGSVRVRDHRVGAQEHRLAAVWHFFAVLATEVDDEQRRTLDELERRLE